MILILTCGWTWILTYKRKNTEDHKICVMKVYLDLLLSLDLDLSLSRDLSLDLERSPPRDLERDLDLNISYMDLSKS